MVNIVRIVAILIMVPVLGILLSYLSPTPAAADFWECAKNPDGTPIIESCHLVHTVPIEWWKDCCHPPDPLDLATILDHNFTTQVDVAHIKDKVVVTYSFPAELIQKLGSTMHNSSLVSQQPMAK